VGWEMSPTDWRRLASVTLADFRKYVGSETGDIAVESVASEVEREMERLGWQGEQRQGMNISDWILIDARLCHRPASCPRRCAVHRAKGQYPLSDFISLSLSFSPLPSHPLPSSPPCYLPIRLPPPYPSSKVRLCCVLLPSPPPPHPLHVCPPHSPFIVPPPMDFPHSSSHRLTPPPPPRRLVYPTSHSFVDRHPSPLEEHGQSPRFPTSSDRLGWPTRFPPEPALDSSIPTRYDPLGSLAQDEGALARKALFSSFAPRLFPCLVSRGVLSDGTWTTEHPGVHAFLQSPTSRPSLPSRTSAAIYSLAALHVFYSPSHPSYDAFWHPSIKESTAMFVHQVISTSPIPLPPYHWGVTRFLPSAMKPSPISTAPMTWLGVRDMLWQLTGIQKEYFRSQGVKPSTPPLLPTRRSLRKRKPVQTPLQELSIREPSEVPDAPPRKKSKTTKSVENEKGSEPTSPITLDRPDISTEDKEGPSKSTVPSPLEMGGNADTTPSPLTISSSLPPESYPPTKDDVTQTGTSRGRTKDAAGKKAAQANSDGPSRSSARRTRQRSPSFSSGSSTAVSAAGGNSKRARSSSSASSTSTTVDATETGASVAIGKEKGKQKAAVAVGGEESDQDEDANDNEAGRRSTRTRRRSTAVRDVAVPRPSRKPGGTTGSRSPAEIDKLAAAAEAPRRVRNRLGVTSSRSRKSRKP
jgi:hypothetical protein